jgi:hypothetical protein
MSTLSAQKSAGSALQHNPAQTTSLTGDGIGRDALVQLRASSERLPHVVVTAIKVTLLLLTWAGSCHTAPEASQIGRRHSAPATSCVEQVSVDAHAPQFFHTLSRLTHMLMNAVCSPRVAALSIVIDVLFESSRHHMPAVAHACHPCNTYTPLFRTFQ